MDIFHALPLVAVFILFVLLATDGQLRELYISLLESSTNTPARLAAVAAAFVAIGLISAVLYEAHFALSTMRINIIYSSYSNPSAKSKLTLCNVLPPSFSHSCPGSASPLAS
jgi:hypothetical protein